MAIKIAPIQFVTGKGGVGKSFIAAALAYKIAAQNKKVLLVELGERSFFEKFFQISGVGYKPVSLESNIDICLWDFKQCLREYVSFYIKSEKLYDVFFGNSIMQKLIEAAPALKELAILGKATSGPREVGPPVPYDAIVIDSYSTGHHRALLNGPKAISKVIHRGPMGHHSEKIHNILIDPNWTSHFVVMRPEELPTVEGLELASNLKKDLKVDSHIIMNMIQKVDVSIDDIKKLSEESELAHFYFEIFHEQEDCIQKLKKQYSNYTEVPFCFEIENKKMLIKEISRSLV